MFENIKNLDKKSKNTEDAIVYRQKISKSDIFRYVKAVVFPTGIFVLSIFTISSLAGFGTYLVAPLTGFMWCAGAISAFIIPSQRGSILTETHVTLGVYLLTLLALKQIIALMSGVSSEMLMAAFNQSIPVTSGSAISGWLQSVLWLTAVMTPVSFIGIQAKKVFTFKRRSKEKFMDQIRGVRKGKDPYAQ